MPRGLFITGTDTGVGKTHVTVALLRALRGAGYDAVGMKPLCCGDRDDAERLRAAADGCVPLNLVNPVWWRTPAAPLVAAAHEGSPFELGPVLTAFAALADRHDIVLVEGVGGWRVPIAEGFWLSDLARHIGLPVAVVVADRLGAINHAVLTVESVEFDRQPFAGIFLSAPARIPAAEHVATSNHRANFAAFGWKLLGDLPYECVEVPRESVASTVSAFDTRVF